MMNKYCDIKIQPMGSATLEERFLLSYDGKFYETGIALAKLLKEIQRYNLVDDGIAAYIQEKENAYTVDEIKRVIEKYLDPIFDKKNKKNSFLYEKKILNPVQIDWFSNRFLMLFNQYCMVLILITAIVLDLFFFLTTDKLLEYNTKLNLYGICGLLLFMFASSFFHELGHASACKYFGLSHGGIGFGLYLNFPVLYTDVTEVWKLSRKQRCVVNIAGVYFQCFLLVGLLIAFFITGNDIVRYLILLINLGFVMTLNPFFRFDGYWIASDLLGVPNLRERSKELFKYYISKTLRYSVDKKPYMLKIRMLERTGFLVYAVIMSLFMASYFLYIIPTFIYHFIRTFPDEVNELILYLSNGLTPPFTLIHNMAAQLLFIGLISYLFYKTVSPIVIKRYAVK